jgi:hypothetical protein
VIRTDQPVAPPGSSISSNVAEPSTIVFSRFPILLFFRLPVPVRLDERRQLCNVGSNASCLVMREPVHDGAAAVVIGIGFKVDMGERLARGVANDEALFQLVSSP